MSKAVTYLLIIGIFSAVTAVLLIRNSRNEDKLPPTPTVTATLNSSPDNTQMTVGKTIKLENGLEIEDIKVGYGQEARSGNTVSVNYLGTFQDGSKFDSSYDRGQAFQFLLGAGQVIKGWDLGVVGMKVGGKRRLVIPPLLGYGETANGPIPGNSTLVFEVELLAVQEAKK